MCVWASPTGASWDLKGQGGRTHLHEPLQSRGQTRARVLLEVSVKRRQLQVAELGRRQEHGGGAEATDAAFAALLHLKDTKSLSRFCSRESRRLRSVWGGHLRVGFLLMNHHLHGELWEHLRTDNSGGGKRRSDGSISSAPTDRATAPAHLPRKKIQPATTRGQR